MAERGPIPNRSDQRRRRNAPADGVELRGGARAAGFTPRPALKTWHATAKQWYNSLADSGQAVYYEPSDWATAWILAETMSRELKPRPVGVTEETKVDKDTGKLLKVGKVVTASMPISGASLTAFLRGCAVLGVTEGDRLRLRIELENAEPEGGESGGSVSWLSEARRGEPGAS